MIAWILLQLGQDPSFIVGGVLNNLGINARAGKGQAFVIEADEYDRMFLGLKPRFAVVTNIEHDHPDCYPTPADFRAAFFEFAGLVPTDGALVVCAEDMGAIELAAEAKRIGKRVVGYRIAGNDKTESGEWVLAQGLMANILGGFTFNVMIRLGANTTVVSSVQLQVPGLHNVRNALAALAVIALMGLPLEQAARALSEFRGTARRFEIKGEAKGVIVIDDYAHHPTEIRATLDAARARYPASRIWAVWQPHTYSRTRTLFDEFAVSFDEADEVVVSEVYAAREPKEDFSAEKVVVAMRRSSAHFIPELSDISNYLVSHLKPGDVMIVLSAGDADMVSATVLAHLQEGEVRHE
jgi:UDP-N-acetylmuramate--alanine ligase